MKPHPGSKPSFGIDYGYVVFMIAYAEVIIEDNNLLTIEAAMELQEALSPMLE